MIVSLALGDSAESSFGVKMSDNSSKVNHSGGVGYISRIYASVYTLLSEDIINSACTDVPSVVCRRISSSVYSSIAQMRSIYLSAGTLGNAGRLSLIPFRYEGHFVHRAERAEKCGPVNILLDFSA